MKCAFMLKRMGCAQGRKNAKSKYTQKIHTELQNIRIYRVLFWISEMLQKFIIVYLFHIGGVFSFHLKVNVTLTLG